MTPEAAAATMFAQGTIVEWYGHAAQLLMYREFQALPSHIKRPVWLCARRFGKTTLACAIALEDAIRNPRRRIMICTDTKDHANEIVAPIMRELLTYAPTGLVRQQKSSLRWLVPSTESELILGGFDTAHENVRGQGLDMIFVDEVCLTRPETYRYVINSVFQPATKYRPWAKNVFLSTPSPIFDHPFHTWTIPAAQAKGCFRKFTCYDNPMETPESIAETAEELGGFESDDFKREYLCEIFINKDLLIFPSFDPDKHVKDFDEPEHYRGWIAADFGGIRDKTVALLWAYDFRRKKALVLDERVFDANTSTETIVQGLRDMEEDRHVVSRWADVHPQTQVDLNGYHNYSVQLPIKDDRAASIAAADLAFYHHQVEIHPRCEFLIATLRSGRFNKQKTDFDRNDVFGHMDAAAAFVYGWRMLDTQDPYPRELPSDWRFVPPAKDQENLLALAQALRPKGWR